MTTKVKDDSWKLEWKDMPEYVQEKQTPYRTMRINFRNEGDFKEFCRLMGLDEDLKESVKSAWYPKLMRGQDSNLRYVDDALEEKIKYES